MNTKSEKLISLKRDRDIVIEDYAHPNRSAIIQAYHEELKRCNRRYFNDHLEAWALKNGGCFFSEDTMLERLTK